MRLSRCADKVRGDVYNLYTQRLNSFHTMLSFWKNVLKGAVTTFLILLALLIGLALLVRLFA